jgi:hypothetical protein
VRDLGAVIQIPVLPMFHAGQNLAQGHPIAFQLIRDDAWSRKWLSGTDTFTLEIVTRFALVSHEQQG